MNAVTSIIRNLPRFNGTKRDTCRDRYSNTRVVLSLSNQAMLGVLRGLTDPAPIFTNTDTLGVPEHLAEISSWQRACENMFSIMYLITSGPAATLVRRHEDTNSAGSLGNGQQAWNALYAKYHINTKEVRRASYEKLVNFRMEQGRDPDDHVFKPLEVRGRLNEMGERVSDERFEDILLQGLIENVEFGRMKHPGRWARLKGAV